MEQPIRVGVVGLRRGMNFAQQAGPHLGMELVALCDAWEERLKKAGRDLNVATFARAIRTGAPPYLDVYRGVAMSIVGILAYRSALQDSNTVEVPDFRRPEVRAHYADDGWNPDPARRREGYPWPSILGDIVPPAAGLACARKVWSEMGYKEEGES